MPALTQSVIDRAVFLYNDPQLKRVKLPAVSRWLNEGQLLLATGSARAASQRRPLALAPGVQQDLRTIEPTTRWLRLHKLVCNMIAGAPLGDAILQVDNMSLDAVLRGWRNAAPSVLVYEYAIDEREPFVFNVYPPAANGAAVQILASVAPAPIAVLNGAGTALQNPSEQIGLADGFDLPLVDYLTGRLFMRDSESANSMARARMHMEAFTAATGVTVKPSAGA